MGYTLRQYLDDCPIIGIITLIWGVFIGYKQSINVFSHVALWQRADSGDKTPLLKALAKIALLESVEIAGFITLIVLMVSL